jgi:hypothetical protein
MDKTLLTLPTMYVAYLLGIHEQRSTVTLEGPVSVELVLTLLRRNRYVKVTHA